MSDKIALSLGGKLVKYHVEPLPQHVELADARCPKCGNKTQLLAEVMQWGFWEDIHWYFVICEHCAAATCFRQELTLEWEVKENE